MKTLTKKEGEVLLTLFKDFTKDYNANSLSKVVEITPRGALKILKNLKSQSLLVSKQLGKATFYKINFDDEYALRLLTILLMKESKEKAARWIIEFDELFEHIDIAIIFGSIIKNTKTAKDLDLLLVFKKEKCNLVNEIIKKRRNISTRPIHLVQQTHEDLMKNLKKKDIVLLNIIKRGYVLTGYDTLVKVLKNVTSFQ